MKPLTEDFEAYVLELTKRNKRLLIMLMLATASAALALMVFIFATIGTDLPDFVRIALRDNPNHALSAANLAANLAVGMALRIWFTRQDKMTTLLTHAMVLDNEKEAAIRVLLNKKITK